MLSPLICPSRGSASTNQGREIPVSVFLLAAHFGTRVCPGKITHGRTKGLEMMLLEADRGKKNPQAFTRHVDSLLAHQIGHEEKAKGFDLGTTL